MSILKFLISLFLFLSINFYPVFAQEEAFLKCDDERCDPDTISPFFKSQILWQPGRSLSSIITIKNTSEKNRYIGHKGNRTIGLTGNEVDIATVLELKVTRMSVGKVVYQDSLSNFLKLNGQSLALLGEGKTDSFEYKVTMLDANNQYQGKKTQFDLVFGFFFPTPTPTFTLTPSPTVKITQISPTIVTLSPTLIPVNAQSGINSEALLVYNISPTLKPAQMIENLFSMSSDFSTNPEGSGEGLSDNDGQVAGLGGYFMIPQRDPHENFDISDAVTGKNIDEDISTFENQSFITIIKKIVVDFVEEIFLFIASMLK
jgi:hypothetical protein